MSNEDRWSQVRQTLREGFEFTVQKAEEWTRLGRLKIEIASQKRRLARQFGELGARVYALMSADETRSEPLQEDAQVQALIERSAELEHALQGLVDQYEEMLKHARTGGGSTRSEETVDAEWELDETLTDGAEEGADEARVVDVDSVDNSEDDGAEEVDDVERS